MDRDWSVYPSKKESQEYISGFNSINACLAFCELESQDCLSYAAEMEYSTGKQ